MTQKSHSCPECGCLLGKARSLPDHRRFFGLIRKATDQWPLTHPFQPADEHQLRAFLLVEANYCDVDFIPAPDECGTNPAILALFRSSVEAAYSAVTRRCGYAFLRVTISGAEILTPRSIDFATLDQKAFGPLREAVEAIIENAIGVPSEQLLREQAA